MSEHKVETINVIIEEDTGKMDITIDGNRQDLLRAAAMIAKMAVQEEGLSEEDNIRLASASLYAAFMEQAKTESAKETVQECFDSAWEAAKKRYNESKTEG